MVKKFSAWTVSSFECFENNCVCSDKCSNYQICKKISKDFKTIPPMKNCVEELINQRYPIPIAVTYSMLNDLSPQLLLTLKLWVVDNLNNYEISKKLNLSVDVISAYKAAILRKFVARDRSVKFETWAKKNIVPEYDYLEKVGVCIGL